MTKSLEDFAKDAFKHGKEMMQSRGHVLPALIFENDRGEQTYTVIDPNYMRDADTKDMLSAMLKRVLAEHRATRYAYMSEAWMVMPIDGKIVPPSTHPGRIEILALLVSDKNRSLGIHAEIHRKPDNSVESVDDVEPVEMQSSGRFANLLD